MTPFDINPDNDAGHTLYQEDLIAFHLHELSSPQERAVHRVLHTNPALQAESFAIAATLRAFPKYEAALPLDTAALERHWLALRNSLPVHVPPVIAPRSLFPRILFTRWAIPTLAGSAIAAAILFALHHTPPTTPATIATTTPPFTSPIHSAPLVPAESVQLGRVIPPEHSVSPKLVGRVPVLNQPPSQVATSSPANPSASQPTPDHPAPTQPMIAPPSAAVSPFSASIASNQQPSGPPAPAGLNRTHPSPRPHYDRTTDVTLAALGNFTPVRSFTTTTGAGSSEVITPYSQTASPTVGVLASFHQQFRSWLGYRITATHSEPTFEYTYSPPSGGSAGITVPQNAYELSATYVVRGPRHRQVSTYAEAGAGVLAFHPTNPNSALGVGNVLRSTAVFGISADLALTRHWSLHAGYRALLYKSPPAYIATGFDIPTAGNLTFSNQPVLGLTYRFHPTREE